MATANSLPRIILASTSPRRIELLTQAGLAPKVVAPDIDEEMLPRESPRSMVARLAREKAEAVVAKLLAGSAAGMSSGTDEGTIIIAADTTVVAPDGKTVLGKPRGEEEARRMLASLAGKTHIVFTGYCILRIEAPVGAKRAAGKRTAPASFEAVRPFRSHVLVRVVRSRVKMRPLSREDIARYVRTGEPMDKAGAYGAQGVGMALIEGISGSFANVVGLPICQVMGDLEASFGIGLLGQGGKPARRKRVK